MFTIRVLSKSIGINYHQKQLPVKVFSCSSYEIQEHEEGWYLVARNSDLEKPLFVPFPSSYELLVAQKNKDESYEQIVTSVYIESQSGKTVDSIGGKALQYIYDDLQRYLDSHGGEGDE